MARPALPIRRLLWGGTSAVLLLIAVGSVAVRGVIGPPLARGMEVSELVERLGEPDAVLEEAGPLSERLGGYVFWSHRMDREPPWPTVLGELSLYYAQRRTQRQDPPEMEPGESILWFERPGTRALLVRTRDGRVAEILWAGT